MQRAILVLILIIVGIGIYLFNQKSTSLENPPNLNSTVTPAELVEPSVKVAAQQHITNLTTESKEQVLDITTADNFVTGEQLLMMPTMEVETINIEQIAPQTDPIARSVAKAASQPAAETETESGDNSGVQAAKPQPSGEEPRAEIIPNQSRQTERALTAAGEEAVSIAVVKALEPSVSSQTQSVTANPVEPDTAPVSSDDLPVSIAVVKTVEPATQIIQGAAEALQSQSIVVTQGAEPAISFEATEASGEVQLDSTPNTQSLRPGQRIRLQELLSDPDLAAGTVFYIHAVSPNDEQGLWGILQHGLIKTFAQGIELRESGRTLTAEIPMLADETLENRRSSFLGEFLYQKVQDTYVYNYQQGMLGQDPDLIKPGQQLIIVSYTEDELISIFNHFTRPGA